MLALVIGSLVFYRLMLGSWQNFGRLAMIP
jgi:hypothetical protein